MRWKNDLTKDIRLHNNLDDLDSSGNLAFKGIVPQRAHPWALRGRTFSSCNQESLQAEFLRIKNKCEFIMEIGVDRDGYDNSSTKILIETKRPETIYLGIDINPKTQLDNPINNVYTLCCESQNYTKVNAKIQEIGAGKLGFFMIDGWHSINQVLKEWEYTNMLADYGIVGFHDTRYHPGPHLFVKHLDQTKWNVTKDACSGVAANEDYGIGFASKKRKEIDSVSA